MTVDPQHGGPHVHYAKLKRLAELHELGKISDREFARKKRSILRGEEDAAAKQVEVLAAIYQSDAEARGALEQLLRMHRDGDIRLLDAVLVVKDLCGDIQVDDDLALVSDAGDAAPVAGRMIGHIFPASAPLSAAAGTAIGAAIGRWTDQGFSRNDLDVIGATLPLGNSAILAVAYDRWVADMERGVITHEELARQTLRADIAMAVTLDLQLADDDASAQPLP